MPDFKSIKVYLTLLIVSLVLINVQTAEAQKLVAQVDVVLTRLPQQNQNKLSGLARIIETYINETDWGAPDDYEYDVPFDLTISFEEAMPISFEDRYKATITVSNRNDAVFADPKWTFPLQPGVRLIYSQQFDPFRSMIDFYVFTVLGHEFDKVKKFGGSPYFETARQIAQNSSLSSRFYLGWDKREDRLEEYIEDENDTHRYLKFLYYTGEWLYYDERDRETAKQYLLYTIKQLEKVNENKLERFFDLNYYNLSTALAEYEEWTALNKLASLDEEHAEFYQDLLKKSD